MDEVSTVSFAATPTSALSPSLASMLEFQKMNSTMLAATGNQYDGFQLLQLQPQQSFNTSFNNENIVYGPSSITTTAMNGGSVGVQGNPDEISKSLQMFAQTTNCQDQCFPQANMDVMKDFAYNGQSVCDDQYRYQQMNTFNNNFYAPPNNTSFNNNYIKAANVLQNDFNFLYHQLIFQQLYQQQLQLRGGYRIPFDINATTTTPQPPPTATIAETNNCFNCITANNVSYNNNNDNNFKIKDNFNNSDNNFNRNRVKYPGVGTKKYQQKRYNSKFEKLGSVKHCVFCENNNEPEEVVKSHAVRDISGDVLCPKLRTYICPICKATGNNAHTIKYCPKKPIITMEDTIRAEAFRLMKMNLMKAQTQTKV